MINVAIEIFFAPSPQMAPGGSRPPGGSGSSLLRQCLSDRYGRSHCSMPDTQDFHHQSWEFKHPKMWVNHQEGGIHQKKCDLSLKHQTNRILIIKNGDFRLKTMEFLYGCSEHGANDPIQILGSNHWILPARLSLSRLGCRQNTMVSGQKAGQWNLWYSPLRLQWLRSPGATPAHLRCWPGVWHPHVVSQSLYAPDVPDVT